MPQNLRNRFSIFVKNRIIIGSGMDNNSNISQSIYELDLDLDDSMPFMHVPRSFAGVCYYNDNDMVSKRKLFLEFSEFHCKLK